MKIRKIRIGDALWTEMEDRSQKIGLSVSALVRMLVIQGMATPTPDPAPEVREGAGGLSGLAPAVLPVVLEPGTIRADSDPRGRGEG